MPLHNHPPAGTPAVNAKKNANTPAAPADPAPAAAAPTSEAPHHAAEESDTKASPKPVTNEEKKNLFLSLGSHDDAIKSAEKALESARDGRSRYIGSIVERVGKGPFRFRGEEFSFAKGKGVDGEDTRWSKRVKQEKEVQTIE